MNTVSQYRFDDGDDDFEKRLTPDALLEIANETDFGTDEPPDSNVVPLDEIAATQELLLRLGYPMEVVEAVLEQTREETLNAMERAA